MNPPLDRSEYDEIYRRTFGKDFTRQACREGFERWQRFWASGATAMELHLIGAEPLPWNESEHIVLGCGPLGFHWRTSAKNFPALLEQWNINGKVFGEALNDRDPRSVARTVIHNALVDGQVCELPMSAMVASAIMWLLSTNEAQVPLDMFHCLGYDITYVPGPIGQARMFNFRAILSQEFDREVFFRTRELSLPKWRPPPSKVK